MKHDLNLQRFADGGGDGASAGIGSDTGSGIAPSDGKGKGGATASQNDGSIAEPKAVDESNAAKTKSQLFDELIKGEYKDEFSKRTQNIVNKRFKEMKTLEETIESQSSIMNRLSERYGVDGKDVKGLLKAIDEDESYLETEAMEKGLTVDQLKEFKDLQRQNDEFRRAEAEAEKRQKSQQIYADWTRQAEELKEKYGLTNFSLEEEVLNPDFTRLLASGVDVKGAYMALHIDDMLGGAMAHATQVTKEQMANSIASRQGRPSENGVSSQTSQNFKIDVNNMSRKEREDIERQVMRGAIIRL